MVVANSAASLRVLPFPLIIALLHEAWGLLHAGARIHETVHMPELDHVPVPTVRCWRCAQKQEKQVRDSPPRWRLQEARILGLSTQKAPPASKDQASGHTAPEW